MPDKGRRRSVNGVGHQFVEQELGLFRHEDRLLRDTVIGEVFLHIREIPLNRYDVLLQKACKIAGDVLVNPAQRRFRRLRHREYAIHGLYRGLGGFFLSGHRCHSHSVVIRRAGSGCPADTAGIHFRHWFLVARRWQAHWHP